MDWSVAELWLFSLLHLRLPSFSSTFLSLILRWYWQEYIMKHPWGIHCNVLTFRPCDIIIETISTAEFRCFKDCYFFQVFITHHTYILTLIEVPQVCLTVASFYFPEIKVLSPPPSTPPTPPPPQGYEYLIRCWLLLGSSGIIKVIWQHCWGVAQHIRRQSLYSCTKSNWG